MNTLELMDAMSVDACMKGGGVCSANDVLHNTFKRPTYIIVNTAESNRLGSHWVGIYLPDTGPVEFFDSLGKSPSHYHLYFHTFLQSFGSGYIWNKVAYQSPDSTLCGEYCLFFGYYRCRGVSMQNILKTIRIGDDGQMRHFYVTHFRRKID